MKVLKKQALALLLVVTCLAGLIGASVFAANGGDTTHYQIANEPLHTITFYKMSSYDDSFISGAEFSLTGTAIDGSDVALTATSDDIGKVTFEVKPGNYVLKETKAPDGFELDETDYVVYVQEGSEYYSISGLDKKTLYRAKNQYYLTNVPKTDGHITVTKVWKDGKANDSRALTDLSVSLKTKIKSADSRGYTVTFDANGGYFGDNTATGTNNVIYATDVNGNAKVLVSGTYTTPKKSGYVFNGWATSASAATGSLTVADTGIPAFTVTQDTTVYATWKEQQYVNYVVQIYGINQDGNNTITFGPALGTVAAWYHGADQLEGITMTADNFPDLDSSKFENATNDTGYSNTSYMVYNTGIQHTSGAGCIHNDDWSTIVSNIRSNPEIYADCVKYGCTATVHLQENGTTILSSDVDSSKKPYIKDVTWNPVNATNGDTAGTTAGGWSASYIRAYLNGVDERTLENPANYNKTSYAAYGTKDGFVNIITEDGKSLLSEKDSVYGALIAGTPELNGAIKKRSVYSLDRRGNSGININGSTASEPTYESEIDITSDYLWLFSSTEMTYNFCYQANGLEVKYRYPEESTFATSSDTTYQRTLNMQPDMDSMFTWQDSSGNSESLKRYFINVCDEPLFLRSPYIITGIYVYASGIAAYPQLHRCVAGDYRTSPGFVVG